MRENRGDLHLLLRTIMSDQCSSSASEWRVRWGWVVLELYLCSSDLPTKGWPSQEQLHYGNVLLVLPRGQLEAAYIWVPFLPQLRAAYFVTR